MYTLQYANIKCCCYVINDMPFGKPYTTSRIHSNEHNMPVYNFPKKALKLFIYTIILCIYNIHVAYV